MKKPDRHLQAMIEAGLQLQEQARSRVAMRGSRDRGLPPDCQEALEALRDLGLSPFTVKALACRYGVAQITLDNPYIQPSIEEIEALGTLKREYRVYLPEYCEIALKREYAYQGDRHEIYYNPVEGYWVVNTYPF